MALSFAFDPSKGETPETIARRRQTADLIASRIFGKAPANVGEGLNAIGQALIARQMQSEATDAQKAGMASVPALFGGTGANPAAGIAASIAGQPIAPSVATPAGQTSIPGGSSEFTNTVMPLAEDASAKTGVDPRLITAQAILETGNGKSAPGNNLFGIKSHGQPGGNVLPTTEVVNGQPVRTTDSFAAYASPQDSANGYSNFLQSNPRYKPMMAAPTLEGQAAALGQSGYATDPNYGSKVLGIAKGLPAPTGGILADNSASPLDNAQYPAGPVGAPTQATGTPPAAPANDGEDALPANAAPAQGALPTAQAVQAATPGAGGPFPNVSTEDLTKYAMNQFVPAANRQVIAAEITRRATAAQQANDPLRREQLIAAQRANQPVGEPYHDADGNLVQKDASGKVSVLSAADKTPNSVAEYKFYKDSFQPTPEQPKPMDYATFSTAKSRAGATNINNNVDLNGGQTYDKQLAEGLGKAHAALANGVEAAQARARDMAAMQGAIDTIQRNGGTTGGMGQQQILDLKKTINSAAGGLGITTPFSENDISDKEFLTKFNRQIAGAQAKDAVGSRVTNFEMANYLKANPGLDMSITGNQRLIGIQSQIEQRNIAVGNQIRDATAEAIANGKKVDPRTVQKIITSYDDQHHITDPVNGQDLTQSYALPEFQKANMGTNSSMAVGHEQNINGIKIKRIN